MKKIYICLMTFLSTLALNGCGSGFSVPENLKLEERDQSVEESAGTDYEENRIEVVPAISEISELESGFSAVRYDGNYGFDKFLEKSEADSDQDVLRFLLTILSESGDGIQMKSEAFGCSTILAANIEGGYLFGRNFDWQTCDALVVMSYPEDGYASVSTVNLGFIRQGAGLASASLTDDMITVAALYAPLDGMNEKGLCVSVNMIQDSETIHQDTEKPDITTTTAIRLMLDQASTVEEALELLEQYDFHASMDYMIHFAIADSLGNSVAVEYIDNTMVVTKTPILTNFYLAEGKKHGIGTQQSHTRFDILGKALEQNPEMTTAQMRDVLDSVSKDNFGEFESTEWSIVYDQTALTASYYHREDYQDVYFFRIFEDR